MTFKVGDKVRRVRTSGNQTTPVGYEGVIQAIEYDPETIFRFEDGAWGYDDINAEWHALSEGPVRTETVTKRRIVPGVYGRLRVSKSSLTDEICVTIEPATKTYPHSPTPSLNATELDDLAMVASQLAEALRDA